MIANILMEFAKKSQNFINIQIVRRLSLIRLMKFVPLRYFCERKNQTVLCTNQFHPIDLDFSVLNRLPYGESSKFA